MSGLSALLALSFLLQREPPANVPALAGTWVMEKGTVELPKEVTFVAVFAADGGMVLRFDTGDAKRDTIHKGKYKLDGVKLAYTISTGAGERSETLTVKKLTAEMLVVVDPDGKTEEFRREVPKKK
jgi:uncharacterized protein (TIGR03066 family)